MFKTRFEWMILVIVLALLGEAWIVYSRVPVVVTGDTAGLTEAPLAGYLAPDFTLTTLSGETLTLSDYRGRPVVLNFWATWCVPCRVEVPHFQAASVKYNGRAVIIGVDQGESEEVVAAFAAEFNMTYPLPLDTSGHISQLYMAHALPTTIFIAADGVVKEVYVGIMTQAVLEDRLERLLIETNN